MYGGPPPFHHGAPGPLPPSYYNGRGPPRGHGHPPRSPPMPHPQRDHFEIDDGPPPLNGTVHHVPNGLGPSTESLSKSSLDAPPNLPKMQPRPGSPGTFTPPNHAVDGHDASSSPMVNGLNGRSRGGSPYSAPSGRRYERNGVNGVNGVDGGGSPIQKDWRSAPKLEQPELNPDDLLPPSVHQNIPEKSGYHGPARRYESRRNRAYHHDDAGGGRYGYDQYDGYGPMPPPDHDFDDEDPNEMAFAKLNGDANGHGPVERGRGGGGMGHDHFEHGPMPHFGGRGGGRGRAMARGRGSRGRGRRGAPPRRERGGNWSEMDQSAAMPHGDRHDRNGRGGRNVAANASNSRYCTKNQSESNPESMMMDGGGAMNSMNGRGPMPQRSVNGTSRYNRSYTTSPGNIPRTKHDSNTEHEVGDMAQYALSEDFQTLSTRKTNANRPRRRRNHKKNAAKEPHGDAPNTIIGTLNGGGSQKATPKKPNAAKKRNDPRSATSKKGANAVPLAVPKARPAPTNWAANLKPKAPAAPKTATAPVPTDSGKSSGPKGPMTNPAASGRQRVGGAVHSANWKGPNGVNGVHGMNGVKAMNGVNGMKGMNGATAFKPHPPSSSGFAKQNGANPAMMDSSMMSSDAVKVQHVLEVINMTASEYQAVLVLFRRFGVETSALLSVKRRWFVCFDSAAVAVRAINVVRDDRFKLRRIDCNPKDVEMLKNNVPPPMRTEPSGPVPESNGAGGHGMGGTANGRSGGVDPRYRKQPAYRGGNFVRNGSGPGDGRSAQWGH